MNASRMGNETQTWFEKIANSREPNLTVTVDNGKPYLKRWWLIPKNPFLNIFLHHFEHSDEPVLHDHPWPFLSFVLKGRLSESFVIGGRLCVQGRIYFRKSTTLHFLSLIKNEPVWTLIITGPDVREWGYQLSDRWVPQFLYNRRSGVQEIRNYERKNEE